MVEVEEATRDGEEDSDQRLFDAIAQLIQSEDEIPDEAKDEIRESIESFEETLRDHWPAGLQFEPDSECEAGCDFEGDIIRHLARHCVFGAFVITAQQVNATIKGYDLKMREAMSEMRERLEKEDPPSTPKKPLVN